MGSIPAISIPRFSSMSISTYLNRFNVSLKLNRCPVLTIDELHELERQKKLKKLGVNTS